jgi:uncharacterized protein (DUF1810 family)
MSATGAHEPPDSTAGDPYNLERFVEAQDRDGAFESALYELRVGRKQGHWIWFVFPQVAGLSQSATSRYFAVSSLAEARAYMRHRVLGPRLIESAGALLSIEGRTAEQILGGLDAVKLRSSMTLFSTAAPDETVFSHLLERYFEGQGDPATDERL